MSQSATVLLVEDDESMLNGMHDLLESVEMGFDLTVMTASNGRVGLQRMAEKPPDLIVSDIMMPEMNGYAFLEAVRGNPDWIHIPFIFLTARGEKKEVREGHLSGADLYIIKPFNPTELIELIESQLIKKLRLQDSREEHVDNLKKGILQILNHEFRTPLTYVTAYYEMLADGVSRFASQENFQEYLRGIQTGCVRLTTLVDDLIQVIELRTGEAEQHFEKRAQIVSNLNGILAQAAKMAKAQAADKGVEIRFTAAGTLPPVFGDPALILDTLNRLIDNGIKFSLGRGVTQRQVSISAASSEGEVRFTVEDKGSGFPERIKSQIFEPFFQYNRELMEQQGAGIGLTIARGLAELHHGRIEVKSVVGEGSRFDVILPVYNGESLGSQKPLESTSREPIEVTVLIVEDDPHLLEGLKALLEIHTGRYQMNPLTASNGREGLELLWQRQPDLIVSDIMMPVMGGFEFLEQVRLNPDWLQIPFIFLSAKGEQREIHDGLRSGVEGYITKPYDSDELLEYLETQLDRHFQVQGVMVQNFDALKRSILSMVTPDFRLPLSSVSEYSEKLTQGFQDAKTEAELKESLHGIQESSVRLTKLVEDFIALAELKTGEAKEAYNSFAQAIGDLEMIFQEAGNVAQKKAELAKHQIVCFPSEKLPLVFGDSAALTKVIARLAVVGVNQFSLAPGEPILFTAAAADASVQLNIEFAVTRKPANLQWMESILTHAGDDIPETSSYATGLSIAKGHIELHQGKLELSYDPAGKCAFIITLPVYRRDAA